MLNNILKKVSHSVSQNNIRRTFSIIQRSNIIGNAPSIVSLQKNMQMSSFWKNKNVRYFSEENKDPKKEDNKEKDTKKKEKVEDEPEVDEEKKEKS